MADSVNLKGADDVNRKLKALHTTNPKLGRRIGATTVRRMATVNAVGIRKRTPRGKMKLLRKAVGTRVKRKRTKNLMARVGFNVGKKKDTAPHTPLVTLGTAVRKTTTGANRGRMTPNPIVPTATRESTPRAISEGQKTLNKQIERHVPRA